MVARTVRLPGHPATGPGLRILRAGLGDGAISEGDPGIWSSCFLPEQWASYHPHVAAAAGRRNNTLYSGADRLALGGAPLDAPRAGVFRGYDERLRLTKPGASRSVWSLPGWFALAPERPPLGQHGEPSRWSADGERVEPRTVGRGQEFVFDVPHDSEALDWVHELLACAAVRGGSPRSR